MNGAELKTTLQNGGRVFGTMISIGRSPRWVPTLTGVGLDYVIIDTEHSPRSRAAVARIVFARPRQRQRLESLVHPWIRTRRRALFEQAPPETRALVIDAPLLFEAGLDR